MNKDIEILQDWIARDREMRNNSTESDYDRFCEEKCEAIEHLIQAFKLACDPRDDWGGKQYSGTEFDNYEDYFMAQAKEMLKDGH